MTVRADGNRLLEGTATGEPALRRLPGYTSGSGLGLDRLATRRNISLDVADTLQHWIIGRGLQAGDRLPPQRQLAEELGVGMSSIREAMSRLIAANLLISLPGKGTYVTALGSTDLLAGSVENGMSPQEYEDVLDLRRAIERLTVSAALERADEASLDTLREIVDAMAESRSPHDIASRDLAFHIQLAKASGHKPAMRALLAVIDSLERHFEQNAERAVIVVESGTPSEMSYVVLGHRKLITAIEQRDHAGALLALEELHRRASYHAEAAQRRESTPGT